MEWVREGWAQSRETERVPPMASVPKCRRLNMVGVDERGLGRHEIETSGPKETRLVVVAALLSLWSEIGQSPRGIAEGGEGDVHPVHEGEIQTTCPPILVAAFLVIQNASGFETARAAPGQ